jgi:pyruvate,orthophosphate dikinase
VSTKFVYDFSEGNRDLKDLLGGKGANLAEMTNLGLPVPPGFIITTEACKEYLVTGSAPAAMADEISAHLAALEATMGRKLGDRHDPLLVSVRSGAKFSMPGMMETVLNVGLNDTSVHGLADKAGGGADAQRLRLGLLPPSDPDVRQDRLPRAGRGIRARAGRGQAGQGTPPTTSTWTRRTSPRSFDTFKKIYSEHTGHDFPQDPREQLDMAVFAVFNSWNSDRAVLYRRQERIPADLGTAVNVVTMVFGNLGSDSGTGVAFTRDPGTGAQGVYGDYLSNAQGEDVVAGIRNTLPLQELENLDKASFDQLMQIMSTLESHYKDLCDIEFTIERGKLWMLQTRVGKRTAGAAFVIATQLVDEGMIDLDEAIQRVSGAQLAQLMFPAFDLSAKPASLGKGIAASPGAAVGKAVFESAPRGRGGRRRRQGDPGPRETNPDDLPGMIASQGILTSRGGKTSHAAVVARGMARPASAARSRSTWTSTPVSSPLTVRPSARAMSSPSTAPRAGSTSARCRSSRRRSCSTSRATSPPSPTRWSRPCTGSSRTRTPCAASRCAPTPTPVKIRPGPAASAPRASACAAPSTCSSATGASSSSG